MNINLDVIEITCSVKIVRGKHENLLGNAVVKFTGPTGILFTISGFSIWKSKFGNILNIEVPRNGVYKQAMFEKSLKAKIDKVVSEEYEKASICIVDDEINPLDYFNEDISTINPNNINPFV